jgi:hypothetical protein
MQYTLAGNEDGTANLTVFVPGRAPLAAHSSHPNYEAILAGVFANDASVIDLFDVSLVAGSKFEKLSERILVANGRVYLDGQEIGNALTEQIVRFLKEGVEDWKPLVAFFENVQSNPSKNSREQLYAWLAAENFTITQDGMIVGYKGVVRKGDSYESSSTGTAISNGEVFTGRIPNPIGAVVEMPRHEVADNPQAACSTGLHVGTYAYASSFAEVTLEVEVHPRDVVSVPADHGAQKMRVCRYTVVEELGSKYDEAVKPTKKSLKQKVKSVVSKDRAVKVGDVYQDTDSRRGGRTLKVLVIDEKAGRASVQSSDTGNNRTVKLDRLTSRKYTLVTKGR